MTRHEYLTHIWTPYPPMPAHFQAAGRIVAIERSGTALKLTLSRAATLQNLEFAQAPPFSEFLQEGDLVAVVSDTEICLLTPQKEPLPPRTLDLKTLRQWGAYIQAVRDFFKQRDFVEVQTPTLVTCPGTEPSLDVFSTELVVGSRRQKLFLPTSPELHLKKALALGGDRIFEMATCFRNGEITERHQPEFLMLEWYRAFDNLVSIRRDVVELVTHLATAFSVSGPEKVHHYSVAELFKIHCDFELRPETTKEELKALAHRWGVDVHSAESIDDYFFLIFMEKIEAQLPKDALIFVDKYPPYQAALARLTPDGWGDRFEVYWKGLELANAFHELNHPEVQRLRSAEDIEKKKDLHKERILLDEEFFQCLEAGMPPSGGIALGLERLFMALFDVQNINHLKVFPHR